MVFHHTFPMWSSPCCRMTVLLLTKRECWTVQAYRCKQMPRSRWDLWQNSQILCRAAQWRLLTPLPNFYRPYLNDLLSQSVWQSCQLLGKGLFELNIGQSPCQTLSQAPGQSGPKLPESWLQRSNSVSGRNKTTKFLINLREIAEHSKRKKTLWRIRNVYLSIC